LVDMLWERETSDARFDTPERKAGLEKRIGALVGTIGDPAVRRHYHDALGTRLRELFAPSRVSADAATSPARRHAPRNGSRFTIDWRTAQSRGPTVPRHQGAAPLPASTRLRKSVRKAAAAPNLSEA